MHSLSFPAMHALKSQKRVFGASFHYRISRFTKFPYHQSIVLYPSFPTHSFPSLKPLPNRLHTKNKTPYDLVSVFTVRKPLSGYTRKSPSRKFHFPIFVIFHPPTGPILASLLLPPQMLQFSLKNHVFHDSRTIVAKNMVFNFLQIHYKYTHGLYEKKCGQKFPFSPNLFMLRDLNGGPNFSNLNNCTIQRSYPNSS